MVDREIIVKSSFQKLDWKNFVDTPICKFLPHCLAAVMKEEKDRVNATELETTSIYGNAALCVQNLGAKMQEECARNSGSYPSANPVLETLNIKQFFFTLPTYP